MKIEITIPAEFVIEAQKGAAKCKVDVTKLNADIIGKLAMHGLKQKIADAAAGAKKFAEENGTSTIEAAESLMAKVATNLERGNWGAERGAGASADPLDRFRAMVVRKNLSETLKAQYDAIPSDKQADRIAFLMEIAAAHADTVDPVAERLFAADEARKAAEAKAMAEMGDLEL